MMIIDGVIIMILGQRFCIMNRKQSRELLLYLLN